jgi:predicted transcriptional regulator
MKKKERRDRYEITYEILKQCQNPTRLSPLMRSIGGSYAQIKSFLKELEEKGFLIKKGIHWLTTSQGKSYIKLFEKIKNLIED